MGLLSKLKSLLGAGDGDRSAGSGVDVTVERDPSADGEQAGGETTAADEPTTTDAAAPTESLEEEHPADPSRADEEPHVEEAEPEQEAEPETESEPEIEPEPESEPEPEPDVEATETEAETVEDEPEAETGDGEPVLELKGIGPAYAERLEAAGVTTVADLAAADPDDLAERVDLSAKRVGRWIDRAQDRS